MQREVEEGAMKVSGGGARPVGEERPYEAGDGPADPHLRPAAVGG